MLVMLYSCSGGGKPTLLSELARRGNPVVAEAALRVLREEQQGDGRALPSVNALAFGESVMAVSASRYR